MWTATSTLLSNLSPLMIGLIGGLLVTVVGLLDYVTGNEISFSIFYLLPIIPVSWYAPRWMGFLTCGISALVWMYVDIKTGSEYSHWLIPVWNASVRLWFFFTVTFLLTRLKEQLGREASLARIDGLTELFNSRAFREVAERSRQQAVRYQHPVALGYIDVDNFKAINDQLGHAAGDRVLQAVAEALRGSVRATDVVSRLGGDEFAIFMPEVGADGARSAFRKIHAALSKVAEHNHWPIGFSVGVAIFEVAPDNIEVALKTADNLMYRVKDATKNDIIFEEIAKAA
jgi:diguanylate cyclase (GGDEF)-like protein